MAEVVDVGEAVLVDVAVCAAELVGDEDLVAVLEEDPEWEGELELVQEPVPELDVPNTNAPASSYPFVASVMQRIKEEALGRPHPWKHI